MDDELIGKIERAAATLQNARLQAMLDTLSDRRESLLITLDALRNLAV